MNFALIKRVSQDGIIKPSESCVCRFSTPSEVEGAILLDVGETIHKMLTDGFRSESFTVTRLDSAYIEGTYTKIEVGEQTIEWIVSAEVGCARDAKYAVIRTYSWSIENPYDVSTILFETEEEATNNLVEMYRDEEESDRASGYAFECSIDENSRWAQITNFRASGDIDRTVWMCLPVTNSIA